MTAPAITEETLAALLPAVRDIALAAGAAIRRVCLEPPDVREKADGSPLTRADLASHEVITDALARLEPPLPILSEEGEISSAAGAGWKAFWCVDPLDGTKEFLGNLPDYTVNIALVAAGRSVLGVVYAPAADALYWGARGLGAWRRLAGGPAERIAPAPADRPTRAVVSRSHLSPETQQYLRRLGIRRTVRRGSSIKICAVAEGSADIYPRLGPTCLWDTAAGAALAEEAGCRVMDLAGRPLSYDPAGGIRRPGFIVCPETMRIPLPQGPAARKPP